MRAESNDPGTTIDDVDLFPIVEWDIKDVVTVHTYKFLFWELWRGSFFMQHLDTDHFRRS